MTFFTVMQVMFDCDVHKLRIELFENTFVQSGQSDFVLCTMMTVEWYFWMQNQA